MKTRIIVIIGALLFVLPLTGSAQSILKRKTKTTVNEKVDKGMSRLGSKLLNAIAKEDNDTTKTATAKSEEELDKGGNTQSKMMMNILSGGGADIKHEDNYAFNKSIKWLMDGSEMEDEGKVYMTSYYNSNTDDIAIAMESITQADGSQAMGQIITIMDSENKCLVMLTAQGGQKMAIITNMEEDMVNEANKEYEDDITSEDNYNFKKTGRSKNILGYKCFEYEFTTDNGKGEYWLTKELDFKMDKQAIEKSGMPMLYNNAMFEGMVMMEMFAYDEEGESSHILVTEVNTKSKQNFSLSGYKVMSINTEEEN